MKYNQTMLVKAWPSYPRKAIGCGNLGLRYVAAGLLSAILMTGTLAIGGTPVLAQGRGAPVSFADLAQRLLPAVVNVSTTQTVKGREGVELPQLPPGSPFEGFFKEFFERNRPGQQRQRRETSLGSGFLVDVRGYVVTNNHVIQDADEIAVILQDNTRLPAKLIGKDPKTDLAILKVEPGELKLPVVALGDSDAARVGDWIIAIGNPFGLGGTVTAGIISARGRDINAGPYDDFLQTDASINKGNSGGPLFNLAGDVIGINTAIYSPSGGSIGIGFAIPSSTAKVVIDQLIKFGEVKRGWLGVHIQAVTDEIAESLGIKETTGALVASTMKDGPAEKAGIKAGDVILEFNGRKVTEMRRLPRIVADAPVGSKSKAIIWRDGKRQEVMVDIGALKEGEEQLSRLSPSDSTAKPSTVEALGLTLSDVTPRLREQFSLDADAKGVVVTEVTANGAGAEKGIRPGDLIVEVSQEEVSSVDDVAAKVKAAKDAGRRSVLLLLEGQGGLRFVAVRIGAG